MKLKFTELPGSVVAPRGFLAGGVFCDIKRLGTGKGSNKGQKRDLALIVSEVPATVAGLFTTNQVCAAPVKLCLERVKRGVARAIVVNSGNANACTGRQGLADARAMAATVAQQFGINEQQVLVGSTGRIGVLMPMENVRRGIVAASQIVTASAVSAGTVAEAIMTSDTRPKQIAVEFMLGGRSVRIGGVCKGAGMIQPGMSATGKRPAAAPLHATMLCFLTTDAAIEAKTLQRCLGQAVAQSFNRITVDGDMSTNDTVLVLANGLAENKKLSSLNSVAVRKDLSTFQSALNHVCLELAKMIVRDGEGVTRFVTVRVEGARNFADADAAARAVANSALVKTSWFGGDPNWGRIIDALGYSAAKIAEEKVDIGYSAPGAREVLWSLQRGQPARATFKQLCAAVAAREFDLHIRLNLGRSSALIYAADLTEEYVEFNKGDVTDPSTLEADDGATHSKAETLLEALPYIQRFSGETFVIKYGGSFMDSTDPAVRTGVARDIVFLEAVEINPVVVHGGGKAITRAMEKAGLKANFIQGQRVTDEATVQVVDQVLSREINPEVVAAINALGGRARGFAGSEIFTCRKLWLEDREKPGAKIDAGFVGEVVGVNAAPLQECIEQGITPVISPTARDERGQIYNCNADVAAAQAAIALKASRLVFMSDVPGLMRDPKDAATLMPQVRTFQIEEFKRTGVIDKGMIPKMDSAVAAVRAGVDKVSLVDGRVPHSLLLEIFTDAGVGTELVM